MSLYPHDQVFPLLVCLLFIITTRKSVDSRQFYPAGPVVRRSISASPGFLFLVFKSIFWDNFLLYLELSIINLKTERVKTEMLFNLSNLNSNLALTLGYLNSALNNSAQNYSELF